MVTDLQPFVDCALGIIAAAVLQHGSLGIKPTTIKGWDAVRVATEKQTLERLRAQDGNKVWSLSDVSLGQPIPGPAGHDSRGEGHVVRCPTPAPYF